MTEKEGGGKYEKPHLTEYGSIESVTETWGDLKEGNGEDTDWCLQILGGGSF
ncbi:hypothetical protein SAMN05216388_102073 [Halorientalis persicus]|uniref:Lasso RiPP family leader peptide-containing protein n=1 Tax=Halorientalis persicus TaxID=1367881 RepID=A0A1H8SXL2_9EURY|nr:hypothetical protein [Halorientalis persicus]SEO83357.1 hypothetical protein SAMN05216388_102073 [Halorientalis persicus]